MATKKKANTKAQLNRELKELRVSYGEATTKWHQTDHRLAIRVAEVDRLIEQRDKLQADVHNSNTQLHDQYIERGMLMSERDYLRDRLHDLIKSIGTHNCRQL